MRITPSTQFDEDLENLSKKDNILLKRVIKILSLLGENPRPPSLRLHKLIVEGVHSVSVTMKVRIIFRIRNNEAILLRIGNHDEVY